MPRSTIELPHEVEWLSILDKDGNLDEDLLLRLHRMMLTGRRFDEDDVTTTHKDSAGKPSHLFGYPAWKDHPHPRLSEAKAYTTAAFHGMSTHILSSKKRLEPGEQVGWGRRQGAPPNDGGR